MGRATNTLDLAAECRSLAQRARDAATTLALAQTAAKDGWLRAAADRLEERSDEILAANELDLSAASAAGLTSAQLDRLRLTPARLRSGAEGLRQVAALADPVG